MTTYLPLSNTPHQKITPPLACAVKSCDTNVENFEEPGQDGKAEGHAMFVVASPAAITCLHTSFRAD
jgi:hypothetical protein